MRNIQNEINGSSGRKDPEYLPRYMFTDIHDKETEIIYCGKYQTND